MTLRRKVPAESRIRHCVIVPLLGEVTMRPGRAVCINVQVLDPQKL
jgi:hypothetical protein